MLLRNTTLNHVETEDTADEKGTLCGYDARDVADDGWTSENTLLPRPFKSNEGLYPRKIYKTFAA